MQVLQEASVQYGDMHGTIAIDWHSGSEFHDFAQHCGVDIERFFPVALSLYLGSEYGNDESLGVTFYAVDKEAVGGSFDSIQQYALAHGNTLPTKQFDGKASLKDFHRFAKRVDIKGMTRGFENIRIEYE